MLQLFFVYRWSIIVARLFQFLSDIVQRCKKSVDDLSISLQSKVLDFWAKLKAMRLKGEVLFGRERMYWHRLKAIGKWRIKVILQGCARPERLVVYRWYCQRSVESSEIKQAKHCCLRTCKCSWGPGCKCIDLVIREGLWEKGCVFWFEMLAQQVAHP